MSVLVEMNPINQNNESQLNREESIYLENLIGVYVTGTMFQNYIRASIKQRKATPKNEKYLQNKLEDAHNSSVKLLAPIVRFLQESGVYQDLENDIQKFHDIVDDVYGMNEVELKRLKNLIAKIKRERPE